MCIKGMFKTLRITKEEGYLSSRELRLAGFFFFFFSPWKGTVDLGLKGWIEGYQAEMQVGLGTDFRGHKQRHVLVEGRWGKIQSPLPHVGSFFHTQQSPDSNWGSCSSSRLWHIYSETASHASGSGLCVSSNHSPVVTCACNQLAISQMFP